MLRKLSAALLATVLIAGPAFAAAPTASAPATTVSTPVKHVGGKVVHHRSGKIKAIHHVKRTKSHRSHVAAHAGKPAKAGKTSKLNSTSRMNKTGAAARG